MPQREEVKKNGAASSLNLDYLQKRGIGTGLEFEYKGQDNVWLLFDTYYIKDQGDFDIKHIPIENEDRGTVLWRHRQTHLTIGVWIWSIRT